MSLPWNDYLSGGRSFKEIYASQHRAFAQSGSTDYAEDLAFFYTEVDIVQYGMIAEPLLLSEDV